MQWKLATPSRLADRLHRWLLGWGFPWLLGAAVRWPRWALHLGARFVIFVVMAVYPRPKREIARNLARVLGRSRRSWAVRRVRSDMLNHFAWYWTDLFRFAQLPEEARRHLESVEGMAGPERLLAAGRGAILLTAHLGNWELGGVLLGQRRMPVSVVYVRDKFEDAERFRSQLRRGSGVEEIALERGAGWSSLPVLRALRQGRLVAMQGDRDADEKGIPARFFDTEVRFPRGPFLLALMTGTPIVPTFLTYTRDRRFRVVFLDPIEVEQGPPAPGPEASGPSPGERAHRGREQGLAAAVASWARVLEDVVRRHPEQWYTFFDYFAPASAAGEGAPAVAAPATGALAAPAAREASR